MIDGLEQLLGLLAKYRRVKCDARVMVMLYLLCWVISLHFLAEITCLQGDVTGGLPVLSEAKMLLLLLRLFKRSSSDSTSTQLTLHAAPLACTKVAQPIMQPSLATAHRSLCSLLL
jgi:hypothetical protein